MTRVLLRSAAAGFLIAASPLQPAAWAAPCAPARVPPSPEYLDLVTRYASGEHAAAVIALGSWDQNRLRCDLDNLHAAAAAFRRCADCGDRPVFEAFSLRAAILLHADREAMEQFGPPVSEQLVRCGTGPQARVIERLTALLVLVDPDAQDFLSRFYTGMARHAHWSHCLVQAEAWARAGLTRLPKDATLLLTQGIAAETTAFLTLVPAPRIANIVLGSRAIREFEARIVKIKDQWEKVRRTFEQAVAADPGLLEARLRLGRVLWRLNQPDPARACFEAVLSGSDDPTLQYLAHLFLGRVREDRGELTDAETEYRAALAILPSSQSAAVAVSHVLLTLGDSESGREILASAIEHFRRRTKVDPYNRYPMAHAADGQVDLAELRRSVAP